MTEAEELLKGITGSGRRSPEGIRSPLAGNAAPMGFSTGKREEGLGEPDVGAWRRSSSELQFELQGEERPRRDFESLAKRAVPGVKVTAPGRIKGFRRFMEKWGFSRKDAAEILGFENEGLIGELYAGIEKVQQRDVRDRLRHFLSIAVDLDGLYDDDQNVRHWLDQPKKLFQGKTPRELLVEGSMENLLRVQQLVRYEANR
jgi:Protein of unknown function (DUF2384)